MKLLMSKNPTPVNTVNYIPTIFRGGPQKTSLGCLFLGTINSYHPGWGLEAQITSRCSTLEQTLGAQLGQMHLELRKANEVP